MWLVERNAMVVEQTKSGYHMWLVPKLPIAGWGFLHINMDIIFIYSGSSHSLNKK